MFDITTSTLVPTEQGKPGRVAVSIHAGPEELQRLRDAIDQALMDRPAVMEARSAAGVEVRILVDRLGPAIPRN